MVNITSNSRDLPDAARNSMEPSVTLSVVGESSACQLQLTLKERVHKLPEVTRN